MSRTVKDPITMQAKVRDFRLKTSEFKRFIKGNSENKIELYDGAGKLQFLVVNPEIRYLCEERGQPEQKSPVNNERLDKFIDAMCTKFNLDIGSKKILVDEVEEVSLDFSDSQ